MFGSITHKMSQQMIILVSFVHIQPVSNNIEFAKFKVDFQSLHPFLRKIWRHFREYNEHQWPDTIHGFPVSIRMPNLAVQNEFEDNVMLFDVTFDKFEVIAMSFDVTFEQFRRQMTLQ